MLSLANLLSLFALSSMACATWLPEARDTDVSIESRASMTTLTTGNSLVVGKDGVMTWDASGTLVKGCSTSAISYCYGMYLSSNASANLDTSHSDSPRQRNEFHFPTVNSGSSFSYSWKQYLDPAVNSSTHFFHLMQVFGTNEQNPVVTLDALKSKLVIVDFVDSKCGGIACPSTPLSNYLGVYTTHTISGKFGPSGKLSYAATGPNGPIISYSRSGGLATGGGYIKFGTYRLTYSPGMSPVSTMIGDWKTN